MRSSRCSSEPHVESGNGTRPFEYLKSAVNSDLWNLSVSVDNRRHDAS